MTMISRYLSILAEVMQNKNLPEDGHDKKEYNNLYFLIHSELYSELKKSVYPYTSDIIQRTENMLRAIESLYLCREIVGKRCLMISSHITTSVLGLCRSLFRTHEFVSEFKRVYTQIPLVIVNSGGEESVEVINYANIRVSLRLDELKFLIIESGRRKIALNKIIQCIIINAKLKDPTLCIIADNIYSDAEKIFGRAISGKLAYIDKTGVNTIGKRRFTSETTLLMSNEVFGNTINNLFINKYNRIQFNEIEEYIKNEVKPVIYGFWEEYASIATKIKDYYVSQILKIKNILQELNKDIINTTKMGDIGDRTLQSIRSFEKSREKKLKSEESKISYILKKIDECIVCICSDLGELYIQGKFISRNTYDSLFEAFFRCKKFDDSLGKKLLSRLYSYGYNDIDLVFAYIQSKSGIIPSYEIIDIDYSEWEKAKMLIEILDIEKIPYLYLKMYVTTLNKYCTTGKELYAKALVSSEDQRQGILQKSLEKGYKKAGSKLFDIYKNYDSKIDLQILANALIPEACMILAKQNMVKYKEQKDSVSLSDHEFTYYKIAAAQQYAPAIGEIVNQVFKSGFSSGFQIPDDKIHDSKYKENGRTICKLCSFLITSMYMPEHYKEIKGIVLFSLNEYLSDSMELLANSNSALALYCKGNMYEFGKGVCDDLDQAIVNYEQSLKKERLQIAEKRLIICRYKKLRYENENKNNYQQDKSYHQTSTYIDSTTTDDGCFTSDTKILMGDGTYRLVDDVKINDIVWTFNHYTGEICKDKIIANVHDICGEKDFNIINLFFGNGAVLKIVKSHAIFDISENRYVCIEPKNVREYIGHYFASYENGKILRNQLMDYSIEKKKTKYYMPISRYHLNIFAEGILTIAPNEITVNMFKFNENMRYDLSVVEQYGVTHFMDISHIVSHKEYINLPCEYLQAILKAKDLSIKDFEYAINLFREQSGYIVNK